MKKLEIKETKTTFIIPTFKSSYWGPFSGLKIQDLIKRSRTFPCGIFCRRPFNSSIVNTSSCTMMHFDANLSVLHKFITRQNNSNLRSLGNVQELQMDFFIHCTVNDRTKMIKMQHCVIENVLNILQMQIKGSKHEKG